jgi:chorismate mutase
MWQFFKSKWQGVKNWLNRDIIELEESLDRIRDDIQQLLVENEQLSKSVAEYKAVEEANRRDDTKPWFEITSDGFDEVKGVKIAMDWNDAFINYLEELSIKGPSEEAAVQRWLAMVNLHLIDQLENEAIENTSQGTVQPIMKDY